MQNLNVDLIQLNLSLLLPDPPHTFFREFTVWLQANALQAGRMSKLLNLLEINPNAESITPSRLGKLMRGQQRWREITQFIWFLSPMERATGLRFLMLRSESDEGITSSTLIQIMERGFEGIHPADISLKLAIPLGVQDPDFSHTTPSKVMASYLAGIAKYAKKQRLLACILLAAETSYGATKKQFIRNEEDRLILGRFLGTLDTL